MNILFEVLKIALPAIISGIFTFIITKYTYNRNKPLDKLETAYNKVYYPLYKLIHDNDYLNNIETLISKSKYYFKMYDKYIDFSTIKAFKYLCNSNKCEKKTAYKNFENNIYDRNEYLRRRLGYLEPNIFQIYKYLQPSSKSNFRIAVLIMFFCSFLMALIAFVNYIPQYVFDILCVVIAVIFLLILFEIMLKIIIAVYYKAKKLCFEHKEKNIKSN